jgi:hypothetical protein
MRFCKCRSQDPLHRFAQIVGTSAGAIVSEANRWEILGLWTSRKTVPRHSAGHCLASEAPRPRTPTRPRVDTTPALRHLGFSARGETGSPI